MVPVTCVSVVTAQRVGWQEDPPRRMAQDLLRLIQMEWNATIATSLQIPMSQNIWE